MAGGTDARSMAAVREIAEANVAAGYILAEDGEETIRLAEQSAIGR